MIFTTPKSSTIPNKYLNYSDYKLPKRFTNSPV